MKWTPTPNNKFEQPKSYKIFKKEMLEDKEIKKYYMSTKEKFFWIGIIVGGLFANIIWIIILQDVL